MPEKVKTFIFFLLLYIYMYMHSESPSSGVVMSFNAKKTTHFDKLDIFGFFNDLIKKMVKIKVVVNKNRH